LRLFALELRAARRQVDSGGADRVGERRHAPAV
jgi:hypothetical protein